MGSFEGDAGALSEEIEDSSVGMCDKKKEIEASREEESGVSENVGFLRRRKEACFRIRD